MDFVHDKLAMECHSKFGQNDGLSLSSNIVRFGIRHAAGINVALVYRRMSAGQPRSRESVRLMTWRSQVKSYPRNPGQLKAIKSPERREVAEITGRLYLEFGHGSQPS